MVYLLDRGVLARVVEFVDQLGDSRHGIDVEVPGSSGIDGDTDLSGLGMDTEWRFEQMVSLL